MIAEIIASLAMVAPSCDLVSRTIVQSLDDNEVKHSSDFKSSPRVQTEKRLPIKINKMREM